MRLPELSWQNCFLYQPFPPPSPVSSRQTDVSWLFLRDAYSLRRRPSLGGERQLESEALPWRGPQPAEQPHSPARNSRPGPPPSPLSCCVETAGSLGPAANGKKINVLLVLLLLAFLSVSLIFKVESQEVTVKSLNTSTKELPVSFGPCVCVAFFF